MSSPSSPSRSQPIKILIANRSEIACRLIRTYSLYPNIQTVALFTPSEKDQTHVRLATSSVELPEEGPRAYLDAANIVNVAKQENCWGIAPGYGFLSEDAGFVRLCEQQGIAFIGPSSEQLAQLGNKMSARSLAADVGVPVLVGTKTTRDRGSSIADVLAFAKSLGPSGRKIILKAAAGGGGRGIRIIDDNTDEKAIRQAYEACQREAQASFGDGSLFAERYLQGAKHIEVQLLGDGKGQVCHFWERECSLQRRNQKVVEIAPSPSISPQLRRAIIEAAVKLGKAVKLRSLTTIEFLVDTANEDFYFMEANPRIQVEHTITEQINSVDLVDLQLQVALGRTLADLSITREPPPPRLTSIQLRINAESFIPDGTAQPEAGVIRQGYFPTGAGVRVETALEGGRRYAVSPLFDSLLAKLIVTSTSYESALRLARWAIDETRIVGCRTNQAFLMAVLDMKAVQEGRSNILTIQQNFEALYSTTQQFEDELRAKTDRTSEEAAETMKDQTKVERPEGSEELLAHITGVVLSLKVNEGDKITAGQELVILAAMKMEHSVRSASNGIVAKVAVTTGQQINAGDPLLFIIADGDSSSSTTQDLTETENPEDLRPELKELNERKALLRYSAREEDVAKRHANGYLTGRENLDLLVDKDSFIEIGDLVVAAQRKRYPLSHLIARTSGDGIIVGWAKMESHPIAVVIGDYLVLAGTQGHFHHQKLDRIFQSIINHPAPLVFYTEGGGGRPGDTDHLGMAGLKTPSFALMGEIKARGIPSVAVVNGYCFAGNAAFLGTCDIIIATRGGSKDAPSRKATTIGMGGQAMIEGGGLGRFEHEHIGPVDVHMRSGGIDVLVDTEVEAASLVRKIVALFTHPQLPPAKSPYTSDPLRLRTAVPPLSSPRRAYDVRRVINFLLDDDSFIEFCPEWGLSVLTGFGRINGRAIAIIASNSSSPLGGAIDVASGAKVNRLLRLLIRLGGMHLLSLCDTPGFMVGPDFERSTEAQGAGSTYRCFGDWFGNSQEFALHGGRFLGLVLRNGFGLGAQAMLGGGSLNNSMCVAWPNAVFGGMGIEGAVRLAYRKELEAIKDLEKRKQKEQEMIDVMYDEGRALNMAMAAEIDSVIDPATTRKWLEQMMKVLPERVPTYVKARRCAKM